MRLPVVVVLCAASALADTEAGKTAFMNQDWARAVHEFVAAAHEGEVDALFWLGIFHSLEHSPYPADARRAFGYYLKAARKGHAQAEWFVAEAYERGTGIEADEAESIRWLQLAADDGVNEAQHRLAERLQKGEGIPQDSEEANRLMLIAKEHRDPNSKHRPDTRQTAVARNALARGEFHEAEREFTKLAVRGYASAQLNLAFLYLRGLVNNKDKRESLHWLRLASEHDLIAAYSLAVLHLHGVVAPKDVPRAIQLLKRAQRLGTGWGWHQAHYLLAAVYGRGYSGSADYRGAADSLLSMPPIAWTDPPQAPLPDTELSQYLPQIEYPTVAEQRTWLDRAGRSGHLQAQMSLGHLYELGVDTGPSDGLRSRDLAQAYFWYSLAAKQGDPLAAEVLRRIAAKISSGDLQRARVMLTQLNR